MFDEIVPENFVQREERVLNFWQNENIFEKINEARAQAHLFVFYDGPPFATGLPHYGHLLAGTIKDVVPRYKTMQGFYVPRRFGWDCHGLPVENEIEKMHNLSGSYAIEQYGIGAFNEECRSIVLRYAKEWEKTVARMGRWVDFKKTYKTMDFDFMESVWWVFKQLYEKGLVYRGFKVMPFSAKLGTPLSNFEAGENYKEVDDPAITVAFELQDEPDTAFLAWTTTPWTLISNLALTVGPSITYVKLKTQSGRRYILSKERVDAYFPQQSEYEIEKELSASDLKDLRYKPLFDFFASQESLGAFRVIADDFVTTEEGTGIVHTAPAFGESDFYACRKAQIELVCPVDQNGLFTDEVAPFKGRFVKDCDKEIIAALKKKGHIFHHTTIRHRYPFCYRSDTPLIYKAVDTWFVAVEKIKEALIQANSEVHWMPEHIKQGRFGKWLEGARDWAISRNRYWGTPIPIWMNAQGEILVVGSVEELTALSGQKPTDLHRHFIDNITITHKGQTYRRISPVFDCWFESGSMPYAQNHYPFEDKESFENNFPADFIAEGLDQTRGWFYTLMVLSSALFQKPAFRNVVVNGIVLAEDGAKMSKRLKNYPEPEVVINKFGADAIRLYLMHSPAVKADDMRFSEKGVELVLRQVLIPWWNAFSFLVTYARIYNWEPQKETLILKPQAMIDRWILSKLQKLIAEVTVGMDQYDLSSAVEPFIGFIDQLTNWYIRRCRSRFWSEIDSPDRQEAFATLYTVLIGLCQVTAPVLPFLSEAIYRHLRREEMPQSVHLCRFPQYDAARRDEAMEEVMDGLQQIISVGHSLRKENKLKVRQPLARVFVACNDPSLMQKIEEQQDLIKDELNVKSVTLLNDEKQLVLLQAKPNFRALGKKVGPLMPQVQKQIGKLSQKELQQLQSNGSLVLQVEGQPFTVTPEDIEVDRQVKEGVVAGYSGPLVIALDTALTEELIEEGIVRELKNKINTMRKEARFEVTDRIHLSLQGSPRLQEIVKRYHQFIADDVLALSINWEKALGGTTWDLGGEEVVITVVKA